MLFNIIFVFQVLSALVIIGLVLLQHGKGADMGAAFGSSTSGSLFGATGSSNFLSKSTSLMAVAFFIATLILVQFGAHRSSIAADNIIKDKLEIPAMYKKNVSAIQQIPITTTSRTVLDQ